MIARFSSFESRRWLVALALAGGLVVLQIVHAARVTGSEVAPAPAVSSAPSQATPALLVEAMGVVVAVGDGLVAVREREDAAPVAFAAGPETLVTRAGETAALGALEPGDAVRMTVDGRAGRVLQVRADAASQGWTDRLAAVGPLAALALVLAAVLLVVRLRGDVGVFPTGPSAGASPRSLAGSSTRPRCPAPVVRAEPNGTTAHRGSQTFAPRFRGWIDGRIARRSSLFTDLVPVRDPVLPRPEVVTRRP